MLTTLTIFVVGVTLIGVVGFILHLKYGGGGIQ